MLIWETIWRKVASLRPDFAAWVHHSVGEDRLLRDRHISFIKSQALGGALAAALFSVYFALITGPTPAALLALAFFSAPLGIAWDLSSNGNLNRAYFLSSVNLTALVCLVAVFSGGVFSFVMVWLVLVPLEGALSGNRKVMIWSTILAGLAFLALYTGSIFILFQPPVGLAISLPKLALISDLAAAAYAFGIALNIQKLYQSSIDEINVSRENYRTIAQNTSDLITYHRADGSLTFASLASSELLGQSPEELIGQGFASILSAEDKKRFFAAIHQCSRDGRAGAIEFQLPKGAGDDGEARWLEMRCRPVTIAAANLNGKGCATGILAVTRDISLQKAREAERQKELSAAESASRAKTQFIATMSHELRTPLNAIIGFAEFLHRELLITAREPRHAEYCRTIHESGEHLLSVVNDLLDVSKIEAGKLEIIREPFEMMHVARDVVRIMSVEAKKKSIRIAIEGSEHLPELNADRRACKQILLNLLSNAVKFSPVKSEVTLSLKQCGEQFEFSVCDNGVGIADIDLGHLGEPFFQAQSDYARSAVGSGLGLSIVKGMVALHGGSMRVVSELAVGTTITISLPNNKTQDLIDPAPTAGRSTSSLRAEKVARLPLPNAERERGGPQNSAAQFVDVGRRRAGNAA